MSDQQAPVEQAEPTPASPDTGQQTEQFDPSQLTGRLDELGGTVGELGQGMQQLLALAQQPYEDPYQGQPQYDPYTGQPVQQEPQFDPNDPQSVQQLMQQEAQRAVGPIQQQLYQREMNDLFQRYPDIQGDQNVRNAVLENVQRLGFNPQNDMVPAQAVELAYKAYRADQIAAQQQPVEPSTQAPNEQGGATPATPEADPVDQWLGPRQEHAQRDVFRWAQR